MTRNTLLAPTVLLAALGCGRSPAHPCQSVVECAVGWSCIEGTCQPSASVDAGSDRGADGPPTAADGGCGDACAAQVCVAGRANCDTTTPDCEARIADAPACFPAYVDSIVLGVDTLVVSAVVIGDDGAIYLGGGFQGNADFDFGPGSDIRSAGGSPDGFVTKLNPDGSHAWTVTFGATVAVRAMLVSGTALTVTGTFSGTVDFDPGTGVAAHTGDHDGFVLQLTLDGALGWAGTFDAGTENAPYTIARDANGDLYVAGEFHGACDFDPGPGVEQRVSDQLPQPYIVKITEQGALLWVHTYGGETCSGSIYDVTVTHEGKAWVTGQITGTCNLDGDLSQPVVGSGALVAAFDPSGESTFSWTLAHEQFAVGQAILAGPDDSVFIGGEITEPVDFDPGPGVAMGSPATATRPSPRSGDATAGFVLKLTSGGAFGAVYTMAGVGVVALGNRADGELLILGTPHTPDGSGGLFLSGLHPDFTPGWSLYGCGPMCAGSALAAGPTAFFVAGLNSGDAADLDPGPAMDLVPSGKGLTSGVSFLSRYAF